MLKVKNMARLLIYSQTSNTINTKMKTTNIRTAPVLSCFIFVGSPVNKIGELLLINIINY